MITVKFYGLMRLESGIKELQIEAGNLKELYARLQEAGLDKQNLKGCCVLVNGTAAGRKTVLNHGDVVQMLPPVAGG